MIWARFDRHRDEPEGDRLLAFLADPELNADWRDLVRVDRRSGMSGFGVSEHLVAFFGSLAEAQEPRRVVDPFVASPALAAAVAEAIPSAEVVAFSPDRFAIECGRLLAPRVDWRLSDALDGLEGSAPWDLIIAAPPLASRRFADADPLGNAVDLPRRVWRNNGEYLALAACADKLSADGKIAFHLSNALFFHESGRLLRDWLAERGLFLQASLSVLGGFLHSQVDSQVSVFGHDRPDDLFAARITPAAPIDKIVENLGARSHGAAPETGILVDRRGYRGWHPAMAGLELDGILSGSPGVSELGQVALSIERFELRRNEASPDFENTILVPEVGVGPIRTSVDWSGKGETRSVHAIRLDPTKADAEFVANWLNGPGRPFRQSLGAGAIPRIRRADLAGMRIPLPPLEIQVRNTTMRRQIAGLTTELGLLCDQLTMAFSIEDLESAQAEFEALGAGDDLDSWIGRMPFPLASVLRRYRAEPAPRDKLDHLLNFFEALAAFAATLLVSVTRADPARWDEMKGEVARRSSRNRVPFDRPTFGSWCGVGRTLADALRPALPGAEGDARSSIFGVSDKTFAQNLAGTDLWELLGRALEVRNRQAHGGGVSRPLTESRLRELEELLGHLHQRLGETFDRVRLVEPGASVYEGLHRFPQARYLHGTDPVFMPGQLVSVPPLTHNSLYIVDASGTLETTLELVPLVRLLSLPAGQGDAFFFLDRVENDATFRFVSFHYGGERLDPIADRSLSELISELSRGR